jgi:trehalose synthase
VADDPEGAAVYGECLLQWHDLPPAARARILLVALPLDDIDENAAMVNALQRHATVIAQKSLAEGFGLTVSEGMWKGRPVIGSAVGGILDQIADGTGILLPDPTDLEAFGQAVRLLFADQAKATRLGIAARAYVRENFLGDIHLMRYAELLGTLLFDDLSPEALPLKWTRNLAVPPRKGTARFSRWGVTCPCPARAPAADCPLVRPPGRPVPAAP